MKNLQEKTVVLNTATKVSSYGKYNTFKQRATGLLLSGWHREINVGIDEIYKQRRLFQHIQKHSRNLVWPFNTEAAFGPSMVPASRIKCRSVSVWAVR